MGWWHNTPKNQLHFLSCPVFFAAALCPSLGPRLWQALKGSGYFQILKWSWRALSKSNVIVHLVKMTSLLLRSVSIHGLVINGGEIMGGKICFLILLAPLLHPQSPPGSNHSQRSGSRIRKNEVESLFKEPGRICHFLRDVKCLLSWQRCLWMGSFIDTLIGFWRGPAESFTWYPWPLKCVWVLAKYFVQPFPPLPTYPRPPIPSVRMDLLSSLHRNWSDKWHSPFLNGGDICTSSNPTFVGP